MTITEEQIFKIVKVQIIKRVHELVGEAIAEREAEILEILSAPPKRRGFLASVINKGRKDEN